MYLENPKKLFSDLYNIPTMRDYMVSCKEDNMDEDLSNLIGIVDCNRDLLNDGDMNGSCRWDLSQCETEQDREQMLNDYRKINWIWKIIKKEQNAKYILTCQKCGHVWYYSKKPKYDDYTCKCGGSIKIKRLEQQ